MDYLINKLKIIHRDLKAANIFLEMNGDKMEIKIGDFGHSLNRVTNFKKDNLYAGTIQWMVIQFFPILIKDNSSKKNYLV